MRLKMADLPKDFIDKYNLQAKVTPDGYIYCEIRRGMYGLLQAGILAQQLLEKQLGRKGTAKARFAQDSGSTIGAPYVSALS